MDLQPGGRREAIRGNDPRGARICRASLGVTGRYDLTFAGVSFLTVVQIRTDAAALRIVVLNLYEPSSPSASRFGGGAFVQSAVGADRAAHALARAGSR